MKNFILHTAQFNNIMIIADPEKWDGIVTDTQDEALVFDSDYDSPDTKLKYYKAYTGLDLQIKYIN